MNLQKTNQRKDFSFEFNAWVHLAIGFVLSIYVFILFGNVLCSLTIAAAVIFYIFPKRKAERNYFFLLMLIIGVFAVQITYFGNIHKYRIPYYIGGSDDLRFEALARRMIDEHLFYYRSFKKEMILENPDMQYYPAFGYVALLAFLMRIAKVLGGYHTVLPRLLNIYMLMASAFILKNIISRHTRMSSRQSTLLAFIYFLFPSNLYIASHVFRDIIVAFMILSCIYFIDLHVWRYVAAVKKDIKLPLKSYLHDALYFLTPLYLIFLVRKEAIIYVFLFILILIFEKFMDVTSKKVRIISISAILVIGFLLILLMRGRIEQYFISRREILLSENTGLSVELFKMDPFPLGLPARFLFGLISPFPSEILALPHIFSDIDAFWKFMSSLGTIFQIYLLPYLFVRKDLKIKFTLYYLAIILSISITTLTFRHFVMSYPYLFLAASEGLSISDREPKKRITIFTTIVLFVLFIIYIILKVLK